MRILLAPFGSRGDVAPLLALGQALRARGHTVLAAVPENSAPWTRRLGFAVAPGIPDFRPCFDGTHSEWTVLRRAMARVGANYAALESAARGADWIVASMMQFAAASVAEQTGAGYAYVATSPPYLRNRSLPLLMLPFRRTPRLLQDAQWWLADHAPPVFHAALDRERALRGLPPVGRFYDHVVESGRLFLATDEAITPVPDDVRALARCPLDVTPAWMLDEPAPSLPALDRLAATAGPPIVYVGFGSMVHGDVTRLARLVRGAVAAAGVRVVLGVGWSGLGRTDMPPGAVVLGDVPHAAVFPRVVAAVHHGGAGTTATAARARLPQVVVPHLGDQTYHGWRLHELGVAPPPLAERTLTARALANAIVEAVSNPAYARKARGLGLGLAGANGAGLAVRRLEAATVSRRTEGRAG